MLNKLFPKNHHRYLDSPVADWLGDFSTWLFISGYKGKLAQRHVYRLKQVLEISDPTQITTKFTKGSLHELFAVTLAKKPYLIATQRLFERFLISRGQLIIELPTYRFASLIDDYRQYLTNMRGLTLSTVSQHIPTIIRFLRKSVPADSSLHELSAVAVEQFVTSEGQRIKRQSLQHTVAHLRAFLRYCYAQSKVSKRLDIIDTAITYREELPPRALPWDLIQLFLNSIDRSSRAGWRDFMILHLMAIYGLRPSEVVTITLDSINWKTKELNVVQCKNRSNLMLPLLDKTLRLLKRYLHAGRSDSTLSELFLRARSPAGSLKHTAVCDIYHKRAKESGLPLQGTSSYCLRHSFALRLLNQGIGIKAIGDLLGHHSLESTCIYLRLDMAALKDVPLPVPTVSIEDTGDRL